FALSLTRAAAKTSPVGVQEFTRMFGTDWGKLTAASSLIITPIVVMTLVLRRRIVAGLPSDAVKEHEEVTMQAVLLPGDRQVEVVDREQPKPGPGEVLVRTRAS